MKKKQATGDRGGAGNDARPRWSQTTLKGDEPGGPARGTGEAQAAPASARPHFSSLRLRVGALENLALSLLAELETLQGREAAAEGGVMDFYAEVRNFEVQMITAALHQTGGRQVEAARLLKLKPTTLNSKIKMYKLGSGRPYPRLYGLGRVADGDRREAAENPADA